MNHKYRHDLRDRFGIQCGSSQMIYTTFKQLSKDGLTLGQIRKAVFNLHRKLMKNIRLRSDGSIEIIDKRLRWIRRYDWTASARWCPAGDHWSREFSPGSKSCVKCAAYIRERRQWRRELRARRRKV